MEPQSKLAIAGGIMMDFAERTGLSPAGRPPIRYLWTDAHAVCNFLTLYRLSGDEAYKGLATALIDQVHQILGRHRDDDPRRGWISGLTGREALDHPTAGGLRIGKTLNERQPDEPFDERLEWDRDGQYFHYLTKWMHALSRSASVTGDVRYCRWAVELAKAAHSAFTFACPPDGRKRLLWKMSIDLSYPLVPSAGLHDPLDAFVTCHELGLCIRRLPGNPRLASLDSEIADARAMLEGAPWTTDDPLGAGGLLFDLSRVMQMAAAGHLNDPQLLAGLLCSAIDSVRHVRDAAFRDEPASHRLAFRELGLAIGLRGVPRIQAIAGSQPGLMPENMDRDPDALSQAIPVADEIEHFWLQPGNQQTSSWITHREINDTMLATSLEPQEFLSVA